MKIERGQLLIAIIAAVGLSFTAFSLGLITNNHSPTPPDNVKPEPPKPGEPDVQVEPGGSVISF